MKKIFPIIAFLGLFILSACNSAIQEKKSAHVESPTEVKENILFIGNSFTYWNDGVDYHVKRLANKIPGIEKNFVTRAAQGRFHLYTHWSDEKTQAVLNSKKWDKVILQEYSSGPAREKDEFHDYGNRWKEKLLKLNPKTKILLYATWGYQHTTKMVDTLYSQYSSLGKELGASVVPVGLLWKSLKEKVNLYAEDGKHPNRLGTYITACLFYEYIYDMDVTKSTHLDEYIPSDMQKQLKQWAHDFRVQHKT